jgi:hypothetical protein
LKKFTLFLFFFWSFLTMGATGDHRELRLTVQGNFSLYKHYPSLSIERTMKKNLVLRLTIGGGPLATQRHLNGLYRCNIFPEYDQQVVSGISRYSGALVKLSTLSKVHKTEKIFLSAGFDVGAYYLNDNYSAKVYDESDQQLISMNGNNDKVAMSFGALADLRVKIGKGFFFRVFPQGMFYFDYIPVGTRTSEYENHDPFFKWELELGVGIGYTVIR